VVALNAANPFTGIMVLFFLNDKSMN
jgi:hypothetical protein